MLLAWYPLNGDFNDFSGRRTTLGNNNGDSVIFSSNIARFNKSADFITNSSKTPHIYGGDEKIKNVFTNKQGSIALWVYFPSSINKSVIGILQSGNLHFRKEGTKLQVIIGDVTSNFEFGVEYDKWYHIVLVLKGSTIKLYRNLERKELTNSTANISVPNYAFGVSNGGNYGSYMNDIRIYDREITKKEISEIYKANTLHYRCEEAANKIDNLINRSNYMYQGRGSTPMLVDTMKQPNPFGLEEVQRLRIPVHNDTGYDGCRALLQITLPANTGTYSFLFYVKGMDEYFGFRLTGGGVGERTPQLDKGEWKCYRGKLNITEANKYAELYIFAQNTKAFQRVLYIGATQITYGRFRVYRPPYMRDSGNLVDSSGFGNRSLQLPNNHTPDYDIHADNPLKRGSYRWNGQEATIPNKMLNTVSQEWTFSCWIKFNSVTTRSYIVRGLNAGIFINADPNVPAYPSHLLNYVAGSKYMYSDDMTPYLNKWIHLSVSFNQAENRMKMHVNGKPMSGSRFSGNVNPDGIQSNILFGGTGSDKYDITDIKLFSKELSDEEVMDEYQKIIGVDRDGKLIGQREIIETHNIVGRVNDFLEFKTAFSDIFIVRPYNQANCNATIDTNEKAIKVVRTPNIIQTPENNGGTYGGLVININDGEVQRGRKYIFRFKVKGRTINTFWVNMSARSGWATYKEPLSVLTGTSAHTVTVNKIRVNCFDNSKLPTEYVTHEVLFTPTEEYVYLSEQNNEIHNITRDLMIGFNYGNTGTGTEMWFKDFELIDVTDHPGFDISRRSIVKAEEIIEDSSLNKLQLTKYNKIISKEFIE